MTKAQVELTPEAMAVVIEAGAEFSRHLDGAKPSFADELILKLREMGWKDSDIYSTCKRASSEATLEKGGRKVEIIASHFLGHFVQIRELTL